MSEQPDDKDEADWTEAAPVFGDNPPMGQADWKNAPDDDEGDDEPDDALIAMLGYDPDEEIEVPEEIATAVQQALASLPPELRALLPVDDDGELSDVSGEISDDDLAKISDSIGELEERFGRIGNKR